MENCLIFRKGLSIYIGFCIFNAPESFKEIAREIKCSFYEKMMIFFMIAM